jgi:murein DD-endopeptidase MepM/ murein hydrolase activator NlpD
MSEWLLPFPDKMLADPFGSHTPARKSMGLGPHRGVDWNGMKKGAALKAVHDGTISANYWSDILGWVVELKIMGPFGSDRKSTPIFFMYCHLDKQSPLKVGSKVACGDVVGGAGTSGSASSGIHLHFTMSLTSKGGAMGKVFDAHAYLTRRVNESKKSPAVVVASKAPTRCEACPCKNGCANEISTT